MSLKYISLSEQRFLFDINIYGLLAEKTQVRQKLEEDYFLIVALSSLYALDIIVTEDSKTMASRRAKQSYLVVNTNNKIRTPRFISFKDFYLIL